MNRLILFVFIFGLFTLVSKGQTNKLNRFYTKYAQCLAQQNYSCAWDWTQKAVNHTQQKYGIAHPYYAQALERKADLYLKQQKPELAQTLYEKVCTIYHKNVATQAKSYIKSVYQLSGSYLSSKKFSKAERLCSEAIQTNQAGLLQVTPAYWFTQGNLATALLEQQRLLEAEKIFEQVYRAMKPIIISPFKADYIRFLNSYARCKWHLKKYKEARKMYQWNLQWVAKRYPKEHALFKETLESLLKYYVYMLQTPEAMKLWGIYHKVEMSELLLVPYIVHWINTDAHFRRFWDFARQHRKFMNQLTKSSFLGKEYLLKQRLKVIAQRFGKSHLLYVSTFMGLALVYGNTQRYEKAQQIYEHLTKQIQQYDAHTQMLLKALLFNCKVLLYGHLGNFLEAELTAKKSLTLMQKTMGDQSYITAATMSSLANIKGMFGNIEKVGRLLNKAEKMTRKPEKHLDGISVFFGVATPDKVKQVRQNILITLAGIKVFQRKFTEAEKLFSEITKLFEHQNSGEGYFNFMRLATRLYLQKSQLAKADSVIKKTIDEAARIYGKNHYLYLEVLQAKAVFYHYFQKDYNRADSLYKIVASVIHRVVPKSHPALLDYYLSQALLKYDTKKYQEALPLFQKIVDAHTSKLFHNFDFFSEIEKKQYLVLYQKIFHFVYNFTIHRYHQQPASLDLAYNIQLNHKGSLLNTFLKTKQQVLASKNDSLINIYRHWLDQKTRLNNYYTLSNAQLDKHGISLESKEDKANELESQWVKMGNLLAYAKRKKYSWKDVKKVLARNEAAIEMVRWYSEKNKKTYYIGLIITSYTLHHPHVIIFKGDLEGTCYRQYRLNIRRKSNDFRSYQYYVAPIAQYLRKYRITKIYFSPDGVYNKINLNVLRDKQLGYAYEQFDIQLVTSTRTLLQRKPALRAQTPLATACFVGAPDFNLNRTQESKPNQGNRVQMLSTHKINLPAYYSLGGTKTEVHQLADLVNEKGWRFQILLGQQAIEESIKSLKSPGLLHIATHGYFREAQEVSTYKELYMGFNTQKFLANPLLRSGLILAGANNALRDTTYFYGLKVDDGHLTAAEIANMDLDNTDLVVLSACETGQGEVLNGEGVYGLQRAFRVAGAKSILMSLWKVEDTATRQFMLKFYQHYFAMGNKRQALKTTRDYFRKHPRYHHPYYWGAFVLVGE